MSTDLSTRPELGRYPHFPVAKGRLTYKIPGSAGLEVLRPWLDAHDRHFNDVALHTYTPYSSEKCKSVEQMRNIAGTNGHDGACLVYYRVNRPCVNL